MLSYWASLDSCCPLMRFSRAGSGATACSGLFHETMGLDVSGPPAQVAQEQAYSMQLRRSLRGKSSLDSVTAAWLSCSDSAWPQPVASQRC